jgi:hypothetical protein
LVAVDARLQSSGVAGWRGDVRGPENPLEVVPSEAGPAKCAPSGRLRSILIIVGPQPRSEPTLHQPPPPPTERPHVPPPTFDIHRPPPQQAAPLNPNRSHPNPQTPPPPPPPPQPPPPQQTPHPNNHRHTHPPHINHHQPQTHTHKPRHRPPLPAPTTRSPPLLPVPSPPPPPPPPTTPHTSLYPALLPCPHPPPPRPFLPHTPHVSHPRLPQSPGPPVPLPPLTYPPFFSLSATALPPQPAATQPTLLPALPAPAAPLVAVCSPCLCSACGAPLRSLLPAPRRRPRACPFFLPHSWTRFLLCWPRRRHPAEGRLTSKSRGQTRWILSVSFVTGSIVWFLVNGRILLVRPRLCRAPPPPAPPPPPLDTLRPLRDRARGHVVPAGGWRERGWGLDWMEGWNCGEGLRGFGGGVGSFMRWVWKLVLGRLWWGGVFGLPCRLRRGWCWGCSFV